MEAYIYNTDTRERFQIPYVEYEIDGGGVTATYQSPNIPQATENYLYWISTLPEKRNLTLVIDGEDTLENVELLKSFCYPARGKLSPPCLNFKIANLPVLKVLLENVQVEYELFPVSRVASLSFGTVGESSAVRNFRESNIVDNVVYGQLESLNLLEQAAGLYERLADSVSRVDLGRIIGNLIPDENPFSNLRLRERLENFRRRNVRNLRIPETLEFTRARVTLRFIELSDGSNIISNQS